MSLELCSVWDRMRVHVLSRVDAWLTVFKTVWEKRSVGAYEDAMVCAHTSMFPPARSNVPMTPSMDSLMPRTPSSSLRNAAS